MKQKSRSIRKNTLSVSLLVLILALSVLLAVSGCAAPVSGSPSQTTAALAPATAAGSTTDPDQPDRLVDLYGKVRTIQGNVAVIDLMTNQQSAGVTGETLTAEQKAAKQAARQAMSEEERLKEKAAAQALTGETVTVLIPVGVPVKIKETQLSGGKILEAAMTDIKPGSIISVWTEDSAKTGRVNAEYVRISAS